MPRRSQGLCLFFDVYTASAGMVPPQLTNWIRCYTARGMFAPGSNNVPTFELSGIALTIVKFLMDCNHISGIGSCNSLAFDVSLPTCLQFCTAKKLRKGDSAEFMLACCLLLFCIDVWHVPLAVYSMFFFKEVLFGFVVLCLILIDVV